MQPGDPERCRQRQWSWVPRPLSRNCQTEEFLLWEGVVSKPLNKHLQSREVKDLRSHSTVRLVGAELGIEASPPGEDSMSQGQGTSFRLSGLS